jgi:hypothetical protein
VTPQDKLLQRCTVRVDVSACQKGSGFYVASGQVVTCSHVIEAVRLGSDESQAEVTVVDTTGATYPVEVLLDDPDNDVALLALQTPPEFHPCVLLDQDVAARDELRTFGFTEKYPQGEPLTLDVEGEMGGERAWIKLKDGQVLGGMSGAPVLNDRTGGVCGILKRSRDPKQPLGGYAISLATLFTLDPEVRRKNQSFHEKHQEWLVLLDPRRQQYWRSTWGDRVASAPAKTYFVVTLGPGDNAPGWQARADIYPDGGHIGPVPVDLNTVRTEVARLFRDWASRGRVHPEAEQVRLLGTILFGAAFPDEIGRRFAALADPKQGERIFVALRFSENTEDDFMHLPWEHLYQERRGLTRTGVHLAIERTLGFARTVSDAPEEYPEPMSQGVSVLVVAVKPRPEEGGRDGFSPAQRVQEVVAGLEKTAERESGLAIAEPVWTPTVTELEKAVGGHDVIHYVGFGRFRDRVDMLALGGDTASGLMYVTIEDFADSLRAGNPRLVVLELCEGAEEVIPADFAVLAPTLLNQVPAVVAYQYPVAPALAAKFNDVFYKLLTKGASVDAAVQAARNNLRIEGRAFASPALWIERPGNLRLATGEAAEAASQPREFASASRG